MKLYHNPNRIYNEVKEADNKDIQLKVQDLSSFDQYHYLGTDAVDEAILNLKISTENRILDVGSGIGGPARYLAEKTGCNVTALELQSDLHEIGLYLTSRCGLSHLVEHENGDILNYTEGAMYDFVVSWLTFLHIPDRDSLFRKCFNVLKPQGKMYVEDFFKLQEFNAEEMKVLSEDISCDYLPTIEEYQSHLINAGFSVVSSEDITFQWREFVEERKEKFIQNHESLIKTHNEEIVTELEDFYSKMAWLYNGGNLGGLKIIAQKNR